VGGGTTLDLAKVVRCRPVDSRFETLAFALRGTAPWPALALASLWLVPTTAGTGSEVTRWATVWDTEAVPAIKRSLDEPFGYADRAFVDPALTLSCPAPVTRDCALDALAHALEALWNRHANPISNRLAVAAAQGVVRALPACLRRPDDLLLRTDLALAALQAGLAFSQTRTALAHALSYALTLEQGVPHGLACAAWLPTAWRLAQGRDPGIDALLMEIFADQQALLEWLRSVGAGHTPQDLGIMDPEARVAAALSSPRGRNFIAAP
jgi:phosphonate metabolism-associated iron-containing alcohol dehydrogenase